MLKVTDRRHANCSYNDLAFKESGTREGESLAVLGQAPLHYVCQRAFPVASIYVCAPADVKRRSPQEASAAFLVVHPPQSTILTEQPPERLPVMEFL
jgi:hypothetical protein